MQNLGSLVIGLHVHDKPWGLKVHTKLLLLNATLWKGEDLEVWKHLCIWKFSDWFGWKENYIWLDMQIANHYVPISFLWFSCELPLKFRSTLSVKWSDFFGIERPTFYNLQSFFGPLSFIVRKVLHTQLFM